MTIRTNPPIGMRSCSLSWEPCAYLLRGHDVREPVWPVLVSFAQSAFHVDRARAAARRVAGDGKADLN